MVEQLIEMSGLRIATIEVQKASQGELIRFAQFDQRSLIDLPVE